MRSPHARQHIVHACLLLAAVSLLSPAPAHAQRPLNLGFEMGSVGYPDRPWGWTLGWSAFAVDGSARFELDSTAQVQGRRSLRITAADSGAEPPARELMLQVPAGFARGTRLQLSGFIRADALRGQAYLLLAAWGDRVVPAVDSGIVTGGAAPGGWRPVNLTIRVPDDPTIHSIVLAAGVTGAGVAQFDDLVLRVDGQAIAALPTDVPPPRVEELAWLAARSVPLEPAARPASAATCSAGAPAPDLALFDRIVGQARLVGLGESTHGTSEFFSTKHRLVTHLVCALGFDLFAIEANQLAVQRLNAYVLGGTGDTPDAMRVMFRVWNTEEMEALVDWLREYNRLHPNRMVRFIGYDMQDHRSPADSLLAFLQRTDPPAAARAAKLTADYRAQPGFATPRVADSTRARWKAQADTLADLVAARRPTWLDGATSGADSVAAEWAAHEAELFRQAAQLNATLYSPDRDSLMAANLAWALRVLYPASRAAVWAHDVHVSHGGDPTRSFSGGAQMGAYLKRSYGLDYVAFSLLTAQGAYSATRSFTDHEMIAARAFPAPAGSVEAGLAALPRPTGSPGLVVDLRALPTDAAARWLWQPRPVRSIGYAAYDYGFDLQAVMPLEFDGVVFIDRTTASRMLPSRK